MFLKVLGVIDLLAAASLLVASLLPKEWLMIVGLYLGFKGIIFLAGGDLMSLVDCTVAVYFLLVAFGISNVVITALASLFLIQKGAFSLLN